MTRPYRDASRAACTSSAEASQLPTMPSPTSQIRSGLTRQPRVLARDERNASLASRLVAALVPRDTKGVVMGLGKKAKNDAKAVKGKTKKDAGKVKHKGKKAKNAAKH
jgi:hypothetical protein